MARRMRRSFFLDGGEGSRKLKAGTKDAAEFFSGWRDMLPHVRDHGTKPEFVRETPGMQKPAPSSYEERFLPRRARVSR